MTASARRVAFTALLDIVGKSKYTNLALQHALTQSKLEPRDRALCTEIVYGSVQRQRSLDVLLKPLIHRDLRDLDSSVLTILRMTVYQLGYLDKIPAYAAVNDAVELCKRKAPKAAGFVNGVLRNYMRDRRSTEERLIQEAKQHDAWAEQMGILHSYPTWIVESWEKDFGRDKALSLLKASNEPAGFSVRVNRTKTTRQELLEEIRSQYGEDIATPSELNPDGIRFRRGIDVSRWTALSEGKVSIQDEGAMLIAPLLQPQVNTRVLDMCAGLGTKSTHLAELQGDAGSVEACDIHPYKLKGLRTAAERLGLSSISVFLADARSLAERSNRLGAYDAVLLDAPCTGFGVLRHRPDIRWKRSPSDVDALSTLQRELLQTAIQLVRPGGLVVYCTCTTVQAENEEVVRSVIGNPDNHVTLDDIRGDIPAALGETLSGPSGLFLSPDLYGTDGFYMARLRRQS